MEMVHKHEYRILTKKEKFKVIKENSISRFESEAYIIYMTALERNDVETINYFESFGDTPYQFIKNYRVYNQNLLFGFDNKVFDENGWIEELFF